MPRKDDFCISGGQPSMLARVSRLLAKEQSVDEILQMLLEESVILCDGIRGFIAIVDHDRGDLDVRYTAGHGWSEEKRLGRLKVSEETGGGITSHVAATGRTYYSANVKEDPYYIMAFEDVMSEAAVPFVDSFGRTRGVINIEKTEEDAFSEEQVCSLVSIANIGTMAITINDHRSRETALVQIGQELTSLSDTNVILQKVIDVAAEVLKFEDCSLFLIDDTSNKLVLSASRGMLADQVGKARYEIGDGLTGWTAQNKQTVRVSNPSQDPRWRGRFEEMPSREVGAFMAVPIYGHKGVLGVLRVQRRKSPYKWFNNEFFEDDEKILSTIAGQLGIALDNARLIEQVVKSERMAAWGEMSARSAHMIGNRVFAIKGDINELEYQLKLNDVDKNETLRLAESITKGIYLLEDILNEFREFVKATQLECEEVDVNRLVTEAIDEGFPKRSKTTLETKLADKLPPIFADPKKMKRSFSELIENSVNFQPNNGEICISTSIADESTEKWLSRGQNTCDYVMVRFKDNGPGIQNEDKPRIFNPFYTSRAKGMGLGLSIVKGIVDAHRGVIYESGQPGEGAEFTILLPTCKEE